MNDLESAKLYAQLAVIPVASRLRTTAGLIDRLHTDAERMSGRLSKHWLKGVFNLQPRMYLPGVEVIHAMAPIDLACANALSIAAEGYRQLKEHLAIEEEIDGDPSAYTQKAVFELLDSIASNAKFASQRINAFLDSRGVPLDTLEQK